MGENKFIKGLLDAAAAMVPAASEPEAKGTRLSGGLDSYNDPAYVAGQVRDFQAQVIDYLRPQLVYLESGRAAAAFLGQHALYHGPYADSSDADLAQAASMPPRKVIGISGMCTHAFNGGAMKFMNTPAFDTLRSRFGIDASNKPHFSDTQIQSAVDLERSAKLMHDLITSKPTVEEALESMFPMSWPQFKATFTENRKPGGHSGS